MLWGSTHVHRLPAFSCRGHSRRDFLAVDATGFGMGADFQDIHPHNRLTASLQRHTNSTQPCMTGLSGLVLRRAVFSLDRNTFRQAGHANVHAAGLSPDHHAPGRLMLGRAKAEAQRAAGGNPPSRATTKDLAKQLFPSSSPGSAPQRLTQSSITDTLTKGRAASGFHSSSTSTNPARTATTKEPLQNRPLNVLPKTNNGNS